MKLWRSVLLKFPFLSVVPLALVVCAPMFNYFGHAVELIMLALGTMGLVGQATRSGRLVSPWVLLSSRRGFQVGALLLVGVMASWGVSSWFGVHPDVVGSWAQLPPIILVLALVGVYGQRLPVSFHQNIVKVLAYVTTALAVLMIMERLIPDVSMALRHTLREDRLNFVAPILVWGLPFTLHQWRVNPRRWAMPVLTLGAIFLSNGRIGWVVAPVIVGLYTLALWREIGVTRLLTLWGSIAAAAAAGCVLLGLVSGASFFWDRFHDLASGSGSGRIDIWRFALTQWEQNYFWFGIGVQGFRHLDFSHVALTSTAHPHNAVVQLLLETGIIGAALAAVTLGFLLVHAWRNMARFPAERLAMSLCFTGVAACSLATTSLFHIWWFVFMFVPLAWALGWSSVRSGASKL